MQTIIVFILVLSVLVFVHELGHFIFAKRAGILVREFAIGFGPKLIAWRRNETLYTLRILPLGGYVRMAGEDPEMIEIKTGSQVWAVQNDQGEVTDVYLYSNAPTSETMVQGRVVDMDLEKDLYLLLEDETGDEVRLPLHRQAIIHFDRKQEMQIAPLDRQFGSKTILQRALTIFAGPLFNILMTIFLFIVVTFMIGLETGVSVDTAEPGSPAAEAGLQPGDRIESVDNKKIRSADDLRIAIQEAKGEPLTFKVKRQDEVFETQVTPEWNDEYKQYWINVLLQQERKDPTILEAIGNGFVQTKVWTVRIFEGLGSLITGQAGLKSFAGPLGIAEITGQAAKAGLSQVIWLTAVISLNLAIFNLLPIPALDGSRLVFIGLEAIRGKPIDPNKESMVHFVGFAMLILLMLLVTYNDIMRIFFGQTG